MKDEKLTPMQQFLLDEAEKYSNAPELFEEKYGALARQHFNEGLGNLFRKGARSLGKVVGGIGDVGYQAGRAVASPIRGAMDALGIGGRRSGDTFSRWNTMSDGRPLASNLPGVVGGLKTAASKTKGDNIFKRGLDAAKSLFDRKGKEDTPKPIGPKKPSYKDRNDALTNQIKDTSELKPAPNKDFDDLEKLDPDAVKKPTPNKDFDDLEKPDLDNIELPPPTDPGGEKAFNDRQKPDLDNIELPPPTDPGGEKAFIGRISTELNVDRNSISLTQRPGYTSIQHGGRTLFVTPQVRQQLIDRMRRRSINEDLMVSNARLNNIKNKKRLNHPLTLEEQQILSKFSTRYS